MHAPSGGQSADVLQSPPLFEVLVPVEPDAATLTGPDGPEPGPEPPVAPSSPHAPRTERAPRGTKRRTRRAIQTSEDQGARLGFNPQGIGRAAPWTSSRPGRRCV